MTVGLLLIGLLDATRTVALAREMPALLDMVFARAGLGDYTADAAADAFGTAITAVNVVGIVVAIALSVPRLRDHRRAFPVPLAIGAGCVLLTAILMVSAAFADPGFAASLSG